MAMFAGGQKHHKRRIALNRRFKGSENMHWFHVGGVVLELTAHGN